MLRRLAALCALLFAAACGGEPVRPPVHAAVAANFVAAFDEIAAAFTAATGTRVAVSAASTGKLCAQIANGAPFDVLLAADQERPARLEQDGHVVSGSRFTYAVGRLALYGRTVDPHDGAATLRAGAFGHLAIANPDAAPYGQAAVEALDALGVRGAVDAKLVFGENIGQAMQFVDSGAAELGLVALSQVIRRTDAHVWPVPAALHAPIRQDAALLTHGVGSGEARALCAFLKGSEARAVLRRFGYDAGVE